MTLKRLLKDFDKDPKIKLGSHCAFLFVGNVKGFNKKKKTIEKEYLDGFAQTIKTAEWKRNTALKKGDKYTAQRMVEQGENAARRISEFVHFHDREVLKTYPSVSDKGTLIIIIEGYEQGKIFC